MKKNVLSGLVSKPAAPAAPQIPGIQLSAKISGEHYRKIQLFKIQTRKSNNDIVAEALDMFFEAHNIE